MLNNIEDIYFRWLGSMVFSNLEIQYCYSDLLYFLYTYTFRYDINRHPLDQNREIDGLELRDKFSYRMKIPEDIINNEVHHFCSILEVIVALAMRIENDIMADPNKNDRTTYWAQTMLRNLHILEYNNNLFNENHIVCKIESFLDRNYSYDGDGGLFRVNHPKKNMACIDIWDQACYYITEKSQSEGD